MSLLILIPLSLGMGLIGLGAFTWALHNGQFEDPKGNAERVLTADASARAKSGDDAGAAGRLPGHAVAAEDDGLTNRRICNPHAGSQDWY